MKTIAVIDIYPVILRGMERQLSASLKDTTLIMATNFNHLVEQAGTNSPHSIIIGINSVNREASQNIVKLCKKSYPNAHLIVFDDTISYESIALYFKLGANGCVLKQNDIQEVVQCLSEVESEKQYISPTLVQLVLDNIGTLPSVKLEAPQEVVETLTTRELEIARHLVQGERTCHIAEILGRKPSTISTIKKNLYKKLNVTNVFALERVIAAY